MTKGLVILIFVVLLSGIWIGFLISSALSIRAAARQVPKKPFQFLGPFSTASICVGSLFLLVSIGLSLKEWMFVHGASPADGVIIAMVSSQNHSEPSAAPKFSFLDDSGTKHVVQSSLYRHPQGFEVGDIVDVLYTKVHPEHAQIDTFMETWGMPAIFASVSLFLIFFGVVAKICLRHLNRKNSGNFSIVSANQI